MKRLIVVPLAVAAAVAVALACRKREDTPPPEPPLVRAFSVAPSAESQLILRGSVVAAQRVRLGFKQGGVIAAILVREGDRVASGQVVARLDDTDARSAVRMAQAARDKAQRDAERTERLLDGGAIPQSVRDDARSQLDATEAQLTQAHAALERTLLRSSVAGTVFARMSEPGETVGSGNPVLVIDSSHELLIRAGATERERALLRVGASTEIEIESGSTHAGKVRAVATTPNTDDGLYSIEVQPEQAQSLLPGALVQLRVAIGQSPALMRIPLEALVHRDDKDQVFALVTEGGAPVARQRVVSVDQIEGTSVVGRAGVQPGERIVAEGAYFLRDGQKVRVLEPKR